MRIRNRLVCGVGVNDANYRIGLRVSGRLVWVCPFYRAWASMLTRCYSKEYHKDKPTYLRCTASPEWLKFSAFKEWMERQDWEGRCLDKDILFRGNKVYGEKFCVFVSKSLNAFLTDRGAARGPYPLGVGMQKGKFFAYCNNPFTLRIEHLGTFGCPNAAHEAWRRRKHQHACTYADQQTDPRIAKALRDRFAASEQGEIYAS